MRYSPDHKAATRERLLASLAMFAGDAATVSDAELAQLVSRYLSLGHVEHPEAGCCLPTLTAEVARADEAVRETFEQALQGMQARIAALLGDQDRAWSVLAQAVGAVMLAQAMSSKKARRALLDGVRKQIL